jgi:hypothetical protein
MKTIASAEKGTACAKVAMMNQKLCKKKKKSSVEIVIAMFYLRIPSRGRGMTFMPHKGIFLE